MALNKGGTQCGWRESLSFGMRGIDHQHQEIFSRLDYFSDACDEGSEGAELLALLEFLDNYAVVHFAQEEAMLEQRGYPGLKRHREQHRLFLHDLARLRVRIIDSGTDNSSLIAANNALREWLIDHIENVDRAYLNYLAHPS